MRIEETLQFKIGASDLDEAQKLLATPEATFAHLPGLEALRRDGQILKGKLCGHAAIFGRICFPFASRLVLGEETKLLALPLEESFWAELAGTGRARPDGVIYQVKLTLHLELPQGEKWGGQAFRRMAEAAMQRTLRRALAAMAEKGEVAL